MASFSSINPTRRRIHYYLIFKKTRVNFKPAERQKMKTFLKIKGYNNKTQSWETVATNPAAPAKLAYDGSGVYRETLCATKNAEKLLKGVNLDNFSMLQMYAGGVKIAASKGNLNRIQWDFVKAGGIF